MDHEYPTLLFMVGWGGQPFEATKGAIRSSWYMPGNHRKRTGCLEISGDFIKELLECQRPEISRFSREIGLQRRIEYD